ncbi:uracil-DNA glycosylase [Pseudonocardia nematodicida]|uniref:Uracil-DNA glycosylase n=2 Tax=Pseudonocardia nematodicida TaxID=1206997 RepID=A0ABV1KHI9_9PSEU
MSDARYRERQWRDRYAPHVAPINQLVDELGTRDEAGHPPYVAPMYRGVHARGLVILRDPGPKAGGDKGSGFLSVENDDQTAQRQDEFFRGAGIDPVDVVPWNAYPWYINRKPSRDQLIQGTEPLRRLIELMPELCVVILEGNDAKAGWTLFLSRHGSWIRSRGIEAVATYHPSRQALQHPDPVERERREEHIRSTLRRACTMMTAGERPVAEDANPRIQAMTRE